MIIRREPGDEVEVLGLMAQFADNHFFWRYRRPAHIFLLTIPAEDGQQSGKYQAVCGRTEPTSECIRVDFIGRSYSREVYQWRLPICLNCLKLVQRIRVSGGGLRVI